LGIISISQSQALRRLTTPLLGVFAQAFFEKACVAPLDHAVARGFSLKPFLKRLALRRLITPLPGVFAQAFFEKACEKACATIKLKSSTAITE